MTTLTEAIVETLHGHRIKCYDSGEQFADRYCVYYLEYVNPRDNAVEYVGMSANPFHPQGFGQHGEGYPGRHNGKRIPFADLPPKCKKLVFQDLGITGDPV